MARGPATPESTPMRAPAFKWLHGRTFLLNQMPPDVFFQALAQSDTIRTKQDYTKRDVTVVMHNWPINMSAESDYQWLVSDRLLHASNDATYNISLRKIGCHTMQNNLNCCVFSDNNLISAASIWGRYRIITPAVTKILVVYGIDRIWFRSLVHATNYADHPQREKDR